MYVEAIRGVLWRCNIDLIIAFGRRKKIFCNQKMVNENLYKSLKIIIMSRYKINENNTPLYASRYADHPIKYLKFGTEVFNSDPPVQGPDGHGPIVEVTEVLNNGSQGWVYMSLLSLPPAGSVTVLPGQDKAPAPSSLTSTFRPAYSLGGGLSQVFSAWQTESVNKSFPVSFSLSGNFSEGNYRDFGWSEKVSASYRSWFSVKVNQEASYSSVKQDWKESSFDCEISFNGLQSFPINPGANWFSSGIMQNFKDKLLPTSPNFFGEGGSLNVIPSEIILGYGLKITINLNNASYTSLKTAFQQSANVSVGVGPFNFSGS